MYSSVENNSGSVPAFLTKLWSLVEDPSTDELIHWDTGGTSFHVHDQQRFSREILPLYFKHSNIASFVRQLNMYGFRKVTHIDQGGLRIEKDDLQFQHQFFQKGDRDMLQYIKRKVSNPLVRPAETIVNTNSDEVSRVLTDVKQVKSKQESMDQNLEYIKRENKLLWREVALLRQKHHKQQQIVNKLIQFLVSLVSSSRSGLTIPGLRRMPLAINDTSQVQAHSLQQPAHAQVITDTASNNTIANLIQENLTHAGSSVGLQALNPLKQETSSLDDSDFLINDGDYTIESPRSDTLMSPTPNSGGPIIHELTDTIPTAGMNVITNVPAKPVLVKNEGQLLSRTGAQPNFILTTNQAAGATSGSGKPPVNFLVVPHVQVQSQPGSAPSSTGTASVVRPALSATASHSRIASPASSFLMSPKIEAAPPFEDARDFGLNVSSNISTLGKPLASQPKVSLLPDNSTVSVLTSPRKKRPGQSSSEQEISLSPAKKAMPSMGAMAVTQQPRVLHMPSASSTLASKAGPPQAKLAGGISPAQAASLNNLVQANSDLNTPVLAPATTSLSVAAAPPPSLLAGNHTTSADAMALAAAGNNKDAEDPMLASEQLELLTSDLDGLKGILQDQYKVDPNFLMELFDMSNPWGLELEKELKSETDKDTASTSGTEIGNITGQELVEYNPQDNLFPELLMGDSFVGDIDDID